MTDNLHGPDPDLQGGAPRPRRSIVPGAILTLVGGAGVAVVIAADIGGAPALERLAYRLGLALGPLLLGVAQVLLLVGLWLVWRATRSKE